jgi:hypothetical protein
MNEAIYFDTWSLRGGAGLAAAIALGIRALIR